MITAYRVVNLGQDTLPDLPNEPVSLDREFAEVALDAIAFLEETDAHPEIRKESCWRSLIIAHGGGVDLVREKLKIFVESRNESLPLSPPEYALVGAALDCVDALSAEELEATEVNIGRIATLVGIAGGLVALIAWQ